MSQGYRLVKKDSFPGLRIGNSIRIPRFGLKMWFEAQWTQQKFDEVIEELMHRYEDDVHGKE